jgi:hypothetical protein
MTSPALASAFKANGMLYFGLCSGLGRAVLKGKRPYMRE